MKTVLSNMASASETFGNSGPTFLTAVDWNNLNHRRCIAASLVNGVYTLEGDRQQNRLGPHALAPPWWEFFGFRLVKVLVDDHDSSYFGALFEYIMTYHHHYPGQRPPQYVMAFRGTIIKKGNRKQDLKLDLHCILNNLHGSRRFEIGMEATSSIVSSVGPGNVWLAGHSLGSSLALLIGRGMAKNGGDHLESYLFNPPFIAPPIEQFKSETIKFTIRLTNDVVTAVLGAAIKGANNGKTEEKDPFVGLSSWIPYLFVNPYDLICCEYAGYFKHREKMEGFGIGKIGRMGSKHSIGSLVSGHIRGIDSEAAHLIPSAYLTTNRSSNCKDIMQAHGIQQWWSSHLDLACKLYQHNK